MDSASHKNDFFTHNDFLTKDPTWAIDFAPNGTRLGAGDIMTRKRYANTLETIATHGADAFYTGLLANLTIQAVQWENGTMTMDDLADYSIISRPAVSIDYQDDYRLFSCGSPSSGTIALSILQTISGYGCRSSASSSTKERDSSLNAHRLAEAMRFSYGQRTLLGDPSFLPNISLLETHLLSSEHGSSTRAHILDTRTQNISAYDPSGLEVKNSHGTSHISAGDSSGLAISLTTTVNLYFGSKVMVPESGVILNNQMNDFSIPGATNAFGYRASPANFVRPGKRGLSSIAPVIVEKRKKTRRKSKHGKGRARERVQEEDEWGLYAVLGAAGGSRIITAVVQNVIDLLSPALSPSIASDQSSPSSSSRHTSFLSPDPSFLKNVLSRPRLHDQLLPNILRMEKGGWGDDPLFSSTPDAYQISQTAQEDSFSGVNDNSNASAMALARALEKKGHVVEWTERGYSACQAVMFAEEGEERSMAKGREVDVALKWQGDQEGIIGRGMKGRWFAEGDPRQRDSGGSTV